MKWQERDKILAIVNKINRYRTETNTAMFRVEREQKEKGELKKSYILVDNIVDENNVYQMVKASMNEHKIDFDTACRKISYNVSEKIRKKEAI